MIPVATAALSDSALPFPPIVIFSDATRNNASLIPLDSLPMMIIPSYNVSFSLTFLPSSVAAYAVTCRFAEITAANSL